MDVKSSVPDPESKSSRTHYEQSIGSGAMGHQVINVGPDQKNNYGDGTMIVGHNINLEQSNKLTRDEILKTLNKSPYERRKNRNPDRVPGTCEWFTGHDYFKQWQESKSSSMLWVSANPGCGKSVLAKYLVDSKLKSTKSRTICYFFLKDDFQDQRSVKSALSCILHQLFTERKDLFSNNIVRRFSGYSAPLANSCYELWELWDVLVMASQDKNAGEIVCILDAFDECEDHEQQDLASALCDFYGPGNDAKKNVSLKFLVTSRLHNDIERGFQPLKIPELPVIHLKGESDAEVSKIAGEIDLYIVDAVARIREDKGLQQSDEQSLLQGLRAIGNKTYLWVHLTLGWIKSVVSNTITEVDIRYVVNSLPHSVDKAYEKILARSTNPEEAKKLLHIVVAAARPLTLAEMYLAITIQEKHKSYKKLGSRPENFFKEHIRDLCGLFVNISEDSKIYLLHQTAKIFLVRKDDPDPLQDQKNQRLWKSSLQPQLSHRILCQICIWHLLFNEFEDQPLEETGKADDYVGGHVFLEYSATNWAAHFRASDIEDDSIIECLKKLCDAGSNRCLTWFRIYWVKTHGGFPLDFTALMIASYFGLERIVKLQLGLRNVKIDSRDGTYQRSALSWASENGFSGVVKLLLEGPKFRLKTLATRPWLLKAAKIDARDRHGRTPLSYAAWNGHQAIVQQLASKGARADSKDDIGGTPISYAICTGQQDIANQLMKGAQVDSVDEIRRTTLLSATKKGHEHIVKRLLDNGADIEAKDKYNETPLFGAILEEDKTMIELLLEKGANIEAKNSNDETPLFWAILGEDKTVIEILLEKGANTEAKDNKDQTPLFWAIEWGDKTVIELLLERGANIEAKDNKDQTPLSWAAQWGKEAVVKLLLERGADIEAKNGTYGQTPLWWAARYRREAMVQLLLLRGANIEAKDKNNQTGPFSGGMRTW
ncbi:ankyrin repeat protein [Metarhizium robertsii]|uniref:Ankyrin repeat protein n=1 Tax=Metarhizium robertsii TaxID=568076 RepID=A0A0A1UR23_9HYPO|nr:ankyrin repeat protein [Metarhizium robertsii]